MVVGDVSIVPPNTIKNTDFMIIIYIGDQIGFSVGCG